jgi:arylsulfatase A-like enzyme
MSARALTTLLICLLIVASLGHAVLPIAEAQSRPNVVVILVDDLDAASVKQMPAVNRLLADQGATFTRFFATTPLCCPSRASILRGQYAHNHGVLRNTGDDAGFAAFVDSGHESVTLATLLDGAGYETALIGKYLNGYAYRDDLTYVPPGWDFWASGVNHAAYGSFGYELNLNGELVSYGHDDADYMTDVLRGHAQDFLAESASGRDPFFLFLAPYAPHSPSTPAPRHRGEFAGATAPRTPAFNERDVKDKPAWVRSVGRMSESRIERIDSDYRRRLESLLAVDEMVESLVRQLEQSGALDSTYIAFLSDNGYFLGEHRQPHGKDAPYDAASRVPLIVRGPGVPPGSTVDALALNIDLLPTVLSLTGSAAPTFVDGRSLVPVLTGDDAGERQAALLEGFGKETENLEGNESSTPPFRALRGKDVLYVEYETGERELYNLRKDPYQLSNLARGTEKPVLRTFSRQLTELSSCAGLSCEDPENAAPPRVSGKSGDKSRNAKTGRSRGGQKRLRPNPSKRSALVEPTVAIAASDDGASIPLSLSRGEARSRDLFLRVHVTAVDSPGTLTAAVELPASGNRERLSSVPVRDPGWVTLDIAAALGDTREITVSLRARDGAALTLSGPSSSHAPEVIAERKRRSGENDRATDRRKRAHARDSPRDDRERNPRADRARGR